MASAFGVISPNLAHDLGIVRNVRNVFAHATKMLSFDTPEIVKEIKRSIMLKALKEKGEEMLGEAKHPLPEMPTDREFLLLVQISFIIMDFDQRTKGGLALSD